MSDPLRKALDEMQRELARGWQTKWHASPIPGASLVDEATIRSVRESMQQKLADAMWKQFVDSFPPAGFTQMNWNAWAQPGVAPDTIEWSGVEDPNSWTWTLPPEPEWEYVEEFLGHKLYRQVWPDGGGEQWKADIIGVPGVWSGIFTNRMQIRRTILRKRDMPVRRAADGGLVGWRYWTLDRWTMTWATGPGGPQSRCWLRSPHQGTVWDGPTLTAERWSDQAACEGHAGIHAALRPEPIQGVMAFSAMPIITGRVRGYGRYVLGSRGWRAEHVVVDYLRVPNDVFEAVRKPLSERYQCDVRRQYR